MGSVCHFRQIVVPNKPSPQGSKRISWWSYVINGEKDGRVLGKRLNKLSVKKIMQLTSTQYETINS